MLHPKVNRIFNLFILFALLTSTLAVTPATAVPVAESEQPFELPIASQSISGVHPRLRHQR